MPIKLRRKNGAFVLGKNRKRIYRGDLVMTGSNMLNPVGAPTRVSDARGAPFNDVDYVEPQGAFGGLGVREKQPWRLERLAIGEEGRRSAAETIQRAFRDKASASTQRMRKSKDPATRLASLSRLSGPSVSELQRNDIVANSVAMLFNRATPANLRDVDDLTQRMSDMHIHNTVAVQPPWPSTSRGTARQRRARKM